MSTEIANTLLKSSKLRTRVTSNRVGSDSPTAPVWKTFPSLGFKGLPFEFLITLFCPCIVRVGEIPTYLVLPTCMAAFMKDLPFNSTRTYALCLRLA